MTTASKKCVFEMAVILLISAIFVHQLSTADLVFSAWIWPVILLGLIILTACLIIAGEFLTGHGNQRMKASEVVVDDTIQEIGRPMQRYFLMAIYVAYVAALTWLGFALATLAFLLCATICLGSTMRPIPMVLTIVSIVAGIYGLFVVAFGVPLPPGIGEVIGL